MINAFFMGVYNFMHLCNYVYATGNMFTYV